MNDNATPTAVCTDLDTSLLQNDPFDAILVPKLFFKRRVAPI